ncbi:MAG: EscD/YscD/HrpQ family type III secretion system periplasmic domain-containing protein [Pseudomonadota bacterium]
MGSHAAVTYLLTVLTGPNAGAQQRLTKRKMIVGSSDSADIFLDEFDGDDIEIAVSRGKLRVLTNTSGVHDETGKSCIAGEPLYLNMPATLSLKSNIQINICAAFAKPPSRTLPRLAAAIGAVALVGGVGYTAQYWSDLDLIGNAQAGAMIEVQMPDQASPVLPDIAILEPQMAAVLPVRLSMDDATAMLEAGIAEEQLTGLEIKADAGVIRVSGIVSAGQMPQWRGIRSTYDTEFAHIAPLLIDITEQDDKPPLAVASVWLGETPELTTRDGATLMLGEITESGWRIETIEANSVQLVRGQQTIIIDF